MKWIQSVQDRTNIFKRANVDNKR